MFGSGKTFLFGAAVSAIRYGIGGMLKERTGGRALKRLW
jgi:hypothetical protein